MMIRGFSGIISTLITFIIFLKWVDAPLNFAIIIGISVGMITMGVLGMLHKEKYIIIIEYNKTYKKLCETFFLIIWFLSIFISINTLINNSIIHILGYQYKPWNEIILFEWFQCVFTILIIFFLPGYSISSIIWEQKEIKFMEKMLYSISLSIILSIYSMLVGSSIFNVYFGSICVIIMNIILFLFWLYDRYYKNYNIYIDNIMEINLTNLLLMLGIMLMYSTSIFVLHSPDKFVVSLDVWNYYKDSRLFINGQQTIISFNSFAFTTLLSLIFFISAFPSSNMMLILFPFAILPIMGMYILAKRLFKKQNSAAITTLIFSLFSGLGSLDALHLYLTQNISMIEAVRLSSYKTMDLLVGILFVSNTIVFNPKTLSLFLVLVMLNMVLKKELTDIECIIVFPLLLSIAFWTHAITTLWFISIYIIYQIFDDINIKKFKLIFFSFIISYVMILLLVVLGNKLFGVISIISIRMYYIVFFMIGSIIMFLIAPYLQKWDVLGKTIMKRNVKLLTVAVCMLVYFIGLLLWLNTENLQLIGGGRQWYMPWFVYTVKFGTIGLLSIASLSLLNQSNKKNRIIVFGIVCLGFTIIIAKLLSISLFLYDIEFPYDENRFLSFSRMGLAICSTVVLEHFISIFRKNVAKKSFMKSASIFLILLGVLIPSLFSGYLSLYSNSVTELGYLIPSSEPREINIAEIIDKNNSNASSIITISPLSAYINCFSLHSFIDVYDGYLHFFSYDPGFFLTSLEYTNENQPKAREPLALLFPKYKYNPLITEPDQLSYLKRLSNYLPIIHEDNRIAIYDFKQIKPPSENSSLYFIHSPEWDMTQELLLSLLAFSNAEYGIYMINDPYIFSSYTKTLIMTISTFNSAAEKILSWVAKGGNLFLLVTDNVHFAPSGDIDRIEIIAEDQLSDFWIPTSQGVGYGGVPDISDDYEIKLSGTSSLKINIKGGDGDPAIVHTFDNPIDMTKWDMIQMYVYGRQTNTFLDFKLESDPSNWIIYRILDDWEGWRLISIPFLKYHNKIMKGMPDMSSIKNMMLIFKNNNTYWTDKIMLSANMNNYSSTLYQTENSSTLNYTIYAKHIKQGKIIYLNMVSIVNFMLSKSSTLETRQFFRNNIIIVKSLIQNISKKNEINIMSHPLIIADKPINVENVNIKCKSFFIEDMPKHNFSINTNLNNFSNIKIIDIRFKSLYSVNLIATKVVISPPGISTYSRFIFPDGVNMTFVTEKENSTYLLLSDGREIRIMGKNVYLSTEEVTNFLISNAKVHSYGTTLFDSIRIHEEYGFHNIGPKEFQSSLGTKLLVNEPLTFLVKGMDSSFVLLDDLR
ncbi:MAG: hypothetical protein ACFFDN_00655 [Candidatus Hodarchaeota archaeon]